jgi:hypothetical protein
MDLSIRGLAVRRSAVEFPSVVIPVSHAFFNSMKFFAVLGIESNRSAKFINDTLIRCRRMTSDCLIADGFGSLPIGVQISAGQFVSVLIVLFELLLGSMSPDFGHVLFSEFLRVRG